MRSLIVGAISLIVHTERMRDGIRRVIEIAEITGFEGEVITTHTLFKFVYEDDVIASEDGLIRIRGTFKSSGVAPHFASRARYYGFDKELKEAMRGDL